MPTAKDLLDTALGVTPETPPTFIFQAVDDPVVLIDNTIEYITALRKIEFALKHTCLIRVAMVFLLLLLNWQLLNVKLIHIWHIGLN